MTNPATSTPVPPESSADQTLTLKLLDGKFDTLFDGEFLPTEAMAKEFALSPRTLRRLHTERKGPPRIRLGKKILYHRPSVIAWLAAQQKDDQPRGRRS